jgi:galactan endo-1,6-beta-galactosidase
MGIRFTSVEPFNEPVSLWWTALGRQEGCHFTHSCQTRVLPILAEELEKRGLQNVEITASDENTYDQAVGSFSAISSNKEAARFLGKVNVHGYQGLGGARGKLYQLVSKAGLRIWQSEYGCADGSGMKMAACMLKDFEQMHPTAWLYWQLIDEAPGWGCVKATCRGKNPELESVNNKHYVLAQFSRHIRPGMTIIQSGEKHTVAAYDRNQRRLVFVVVNIGKAVNMTFDMSLFRTASGPVTRWVTSASGKERYKKYDDIAIAPGGLAFVNKVSGMSVQTIEVEGVA